MTLLDIGRANWLVERIGAAVDGIDPRNADTPPVGAVAASAFGNTASASYCHDAWRDTAAEAETACGYLRTSLEADEDRLLAVVHVFRQTDDEAADEICSAAMRSNTLDVYNTHLDSKSEERRADQLDTAVDQIEPSIGPAIFAGDFNIDTLRETPPEIDRLHQQGWVDASTDTNGVPVATHGDEDHLKAIDKVYTSPGVVVTGPATVIPGGPSDHEGLVVDAAVPPAWP